MTLTPVTFWTEWSYCGHFRAKIYHEIYPSMTFFHQSFHIVTPCIIELFPNKFHFVLGGEDLKDMPISNYSHLQSTLGIYDDKVWINFESQNRLQSSFLECSKKYFRIFFESFLRRASKE